MCIRDRYATLRDWEINRHKVLVEAKKLFDNICESIFTALTTAIANNKNLMKWFETLLIGLKEFSKQTASLPNLSLLATYSAMPEACLFTVLPDANKALSRNVKDLAKHTESSILSELRDVIASYNKTVHTQKEIYPTLSKNMKETEKKLMKLFNGYTMAARKKEEGILEMGGKERVDPWVSYHQYVVALKGQFNNVSKYGEYCRELVKIRRNLETMRINSCTKSLKDYLLKYSACFGESGTFGSLLPSVQELDIGKSAEDIILLDTNGGEASAPLKYKHTQLAELEELMKAKMSSFCPLPDVTLIERKLSCKRPGGIFSGMINCVAVHTKDQYLHVLDKEDSEMPAFSLDLKKTQARNEGTTIELLERKDAMSIMEKLNIRSSHKIVVEGEEVAKEWVLRINEIN
eukprot:TRINITY_DN4294_c0_g1_i7.p1 TRINITY_DN4294_c0_g1~~TRINITY_DN4294_c0_g1_i7.p1  ORF type:complete len:406 (+),score=126.46 TRINITY_DN4294_c0_g1_i7:73-1290(+)